MAELCETVKGCCIVSSRLYPASPDAVLPPAQPFEASEVAAKRKLCAVAMRGDILSAYEPTMKEKEEVKVEKPSSDACPKCHADVRMICELGRKHDEIFIKFKGYRYCGSCSDTAPGRGANVCKELGLGSEKYCSHTE